MKETENPLDNSLKLIIKSSVIILIGFFVSKLATYLFRIIAARTYGPEIWGIYSLALMVLGWITILSSFGLFDGLLRFIPLFRGKNETSKINYIVNVVKYVTLILGIFFGVLIYFLAPYISINLFHNRELIWFLQISSFFIFLTNLSLLYVIIIRGYERIKQYSLFYNIIQNTVRLIFLIIFIFLGFQGGFVLIAYFLGTVALFLVSYAYTKINLKEVYKKYSLKLEQKKEIINNLFIFSIPILFYSTVNTVLAGVDSFSIGYFRTISEVGIYNVIIPIAIIFTVTTEIFMQLFFPLVTREYSKKNYPLIKQLSQQIGKWIFILNMPALILVLLFPGAVINILFGKEYLAGENALRLLSIGYFIFSISTVSSNLILIKGKSKTIFFSISASAIINIILNFILVPRYGITGAAFSTTTSLIVLSVIYLINAKISFNIIPMKKEAIRIFLVALIPTIFLLVIKHFIDINALSIIVLGISFLLVYIFLIFLSSCLDDNDMMIIRAIKRKLLPETRTMHH